MSSLVERVHVVSAFVKQWKKLKQGRSVVLDHVAPEAWPFALALAAQTLRDKRIWLICSDARVQEQVHGELPIWGVPSICFPRMHAATVAWGLPDPDAQAERISALTRFIGQDAEVSNIMVICQDSLDEEVPAAQELESQRRSLHNGMKLDPESLQEDLTGSGYHRVPVVSERGQFARRGGILDVFSWQGEEPLRLEFFDDVIESLRIFDIHTQTSVRRLERLSLLLQATDADTATTPLKQFMRSEDVVFSLECDLPFPAQLTVTSGARADQIEEDYTTAIFENPLGVLAAGDFVMHEARRAHFLKQVEDWRREKWQVVMFFYNQGERERFEELVGSAWLVKQKVELTLGLLHRGFTVPAAKLAVITGAEIFGRHQHTRRVRGSKLDEAQVLRQARDHLREMREGDLVVHVDYGIGKYVGIEVREGVRREEVMVILYAEEAKIFVPLSQSHLVSRYIGVGGKSPSLNKLGDARWGKTRANAERSVEEFAAKMLSIAAQRKSIKGFEHPPDTKWQVEFEQSFLYRETPDQLRAIEEIKRDMEHERPMDRLLCGDVGFGKTEVAIRAAFKAVMGGRQVAVLVPTTVLAQQHLNTFRERMSDYPVKVEMLSRLTPPKAERLILKGVRDGTVDIVIGTHRVISKDVQFKQLGLAVVDEEQRFGVKHKERFKELFRLVDVLTLSATPIPRTLYLGLM
ncbi:MAG: transcription-repair coupling factor, partial [Verrucomicrobiota bacterium]